MAKFCKHSASFLVAACLAVDVAAQDASPLDAEISAINGQILEVEATIADSDGRLIRTLAETRREALLLLRTMVKNRQQAEAGGATIEVTVPAVEPDLQRAKRLLGEMATQQQRVNSAEREASSAGGLIRALTLSRVETEKLTLAQLQMAYLQARYGIAFPVAPSVGPLAAVATGEASEESTADTEDRQADVAFAWADPDHPEVDYSLAPFERAHRDGHTISGWWTIEKSRAAIDDSPKVLAVNYSAYDQRSFSDTTAIVIQCNEGETSFVFLQDDFLIADLRKNSFDIIYRIDEKRLNPHVG